MEHTRAFWRMIQQRVERNLDRAPTYKSYNERDREAIRWIWDTKKCNGELGELANDFFKGIEEVALLYGGQKCAFENVLTRQGFEPTNEVLNNYSGRIAVLTHHGTLLLLGKLKGKGRYMQMTRIHTPKFNHNGERAPLENNLKINEDGPIINGYHGSTTRALAVNEHGPDGDELEVKAAETLIRRIEIETFADSLLGNPYKREEIPHQKPLKVW